MQPFHSDVVTEIPSNTGSVFSKTLSTDSEQGQEERYVRCVRGPHDDFQSSRHYLVS